MKENDNNFNNVDLITKQIENNISIKNILISLDKKAINKNLSETNLYEILVNKNLTNENDCYIFKNCGIINSYKFFLRFEKYKKN